MLFELSEEEILEVFNSSSTTSLFFCRSKHICEAVHVRRRLLSAMMEYRDLTPCCQSPKTSAADPEVTRTISLGKSSY
jgi:hypothetical protein